MVYLPTSHLRTTEDFHREPWISRAFSAVLEFCELMAAAARVSRAVEARKEPAQSDLRTLGIQGKLPRVR